ncbi:hypothetical protein N8590_02265 [bacterium]|jgi:YVTN family beta-propeller protein|nr:hypothetical protein [bacterium]
MDYRIISLLAVIISSAISISNRETFADDLAVVLRRPADMCWIEEGGILSVANAASGSISLVKVQTGVINETILQGKPVAIEWLKRSQRLAIVDQVAGELILAQLDDQRVIVKKRLPVGRGANRISISNDETLIAVSSAWDRRVSLFSVDEQPHLEHQVDLEFEPGLVIFTPDDSSLIVFDVFAGRFAIIDASNLKAVSTGELEGHQIRGVEFLAANRLVLTHQILHQSAATTPDNIAAGAVVENVTQEIELKKDSNNHLRLEPVLIKELGVPSHGAADPASIVIDQQGDRHIALAGVNEVLITNQYGIPRDRIEVGRKPVDLLLDDANGKLYCLNTFDQSISIIDIDQRSVIKTISLGSQPASTSWSRGEELFFDAQRSRFGWFSCHSCHVDGHTISQLADTFGDGAAGAPKRILSLLGGRDNNPWAWNGSMRSLHDQVLKSGITTMRGDGFSAKEANDLVAYLHTLEPPPPFRPPIDEQAQKLIEQGKAIFHKHGCSACHIPPLTYTADTMFDVGLSDEHGMGKFNPPSLIGVGYRRAFFHDGRAKDLPSVFVEYGHQLSRDVSEAELNLLIRFLESL